MKDFYKKIDSLVEQLQAKYPLFFTDGQKITHELKDKGHFIIKIPVRKDDETIQLYNVKLNIEDIANYGTEELISLFGRLDNWYKMSRFMNKAEYEPISDKILTLQDSMSRIPVFAEELKEADKAGFLQQATVSNRYNRYRDKYADLLQRNEVFIDLIYKLYTTTDFKEASELWKKIKDVGLNLRQWDKRREKILLTALATPGPMSVVEFRILTQFDIQNTTLRVDSEQLYSLHSSAYNLDLDIPNNMNKYPEWFKQYIVKQVFYADICTIDYLGVVNEQEKVQYDYTDLYNIIDIANMRYPTPISKSFNTIHNYIKYTNENSIFADVVEIDTDVNGYITMSNEFVKKSLDEARDAFQAARKDWRYIASILMKGLEHVSALSDLKHDNHTLHLWIRQQLDGVDYSQFKTMGDIKQWFMKLKTSLGIDSLDPKYSEKKLKRDKVSKNAESSIQPYQNKLVTKTETDPVHGKTDNIKDDDKIDNFIEFHDDVFFPDWLTDKKSVILGARQKYLDGDTDEFMSNDDLIVALDDIYGTINFDFKRDQQKPETIENFKDNINPSAHRKVTARPKLWTVRFAELVAIRGNLENSQYRVAKTGYTNDLGKASQAMKTVFASTPTMRNPFTFESFEQGFNFLDEHVELSAQAKQTLTEEGKEAQQRDEQAHAFYAHDWKHKQIMFTSGNEDIENFDTNVKYVHYCATYVSSSVYYNADNILHYDSAQDGIMLYFNSVSYNTNGFMFLAKQMLASGDIFTGADGGDANEITTTWGNLQTLTSDPTTVERAYDESHVQGKYQRFEGEESTTDDFLENIKDVEYDEKVFNLYFDQIINIQKQYADFVELLKEKYPKYAQHIEIRRNILIPPVNDSLGDDKLSLIAILRNHMQSSAGKTGFGVNIWKIYRQLVNEANMLQYAHTLKELIMFILYILVEATLEGTVQVRDDESFADKYPEHLEKRYDDYIQTLVNLDKVDEEIDTIKEVEVISELITNHFDLHKPTVKVWLDSTISHLQWVEEGIQYWQYDNYEDKAKFTLALIRPGYYSFRAFMKKWYPEKYKQLLSTEELMATLAKDSLRPYNAIYDFDEASKQYYIKLINNSEDLRSKLASAGNLSKRDFMLRIIETIKDTSVRNKVAKLLQDYNKPSLVNEEETGMDVNLLDFVKLLSGRHMLDGAIYLLVTKLY